MEQQDLVNGLQAELAKAKDLVYNLSLALKNAGESLNAHKVEIQKLQSQLKDKKETDDTKE